MKRGNLKRAIRIATGLVLSAALITVLGQGCGEGMKSATGSLNGMFGSCGNTNVIDKNYDVIDDAGTISILYGDQLLYSFLSCTGVGTASTRTQQEFDTRRLALSEYGDLRDISPGNLMAIAAVAIEVCQDLVDKESPLVDAQRGIFPGINLAGAGLSNTDIDNISSLLSLSCWQRQITASEQMDIRNSISSINQNSELQAVSLCTAMLSSLSAIEI